MQLSEILCKVDHTLLSPAATWEEIRSLCDDGMKYHTASVCIPASYVHAAKEYTKGQLPICTVIGFPTGYATTAVKVTETADAVRNGADEIDMVINIGWLKDGRYEELLEEIRAIKAECGTKILKVIVETCLLTDTEKRKICEIVSASGADFIKTSTGFSLYGATREDVSLLREHSAPHVQVKAAGGIRTLADAEEYIKLGASRLGTSAIVKLVKEMEN